MTIPLEVVIATAAFLSGWYLHDAFMRWGIKLLKDEGLKLRYKGREY